MEATARARERLVSFTSQTYMVEVYESCSHPPCKTAGERSPRPEHRASQEGAYLKIWTSCPRSTPNDERQSHEEPPQHNSQANVASERSLDWSKWCGPVPPDVENYGTLDFTVEVATQLQQLRVDMSRQAALHNGETSGPEIVSLIEDWRTENGLSIETNEESLFGDGSLKEPPDFVRTYIPEDRFQDAKSEQSSPSPSPARVIKAGIKAKAMPVKEPLVKAARPKEPAQTTPKGEVLSKPSSNEHNSAQLDIPEPSTKEEIPVKDEPMEQVVGERPNAWEFPETAADVESDEMSLMLAPATSETAKNKALSLELVVDTGATGSLVSLEFAEAVMSHYPGSLVSIDCADRRRYKVASGAVVITSSRAQFKDIPMVGNLVVDVLEPSTDGKIPNLLGLDWLRSNGAVLDIGRNVLMINGKEIAVKQLANGHLAVDISI